MNREAMFSPTDPIEEHRNGSTATQGAVLAESESSQASQWPFSRSRGGAAEPLPPAVAEREMHVVASIEEWNRGLSPYALSTKYRMLGESPISFFQGTCHLFWADLSGDQRLTQFGNTHTVTWISGNCTFLSFSSSGSDTEGPMYGVNSFEDSVIADYQYDVWRLAVSVALLVQENFSNLIPDPEKRTEGALEEIQSSAVHALAHAYLRAAVGYKADESEGSSSLPEKFSRLLSLTGGNSKGRLVRFLAVVEREYSRRKLIKKWCGEASTEGSSRILFTEHKGSIEPCPPYEEDSVVAALGSQHADGVNVKGLAHRLNATPATCGVPQFFALTEAPDRELHVLDIRMQQRPTAYHFMNPLERRVYRSQFPNEAQRYVTACRALSPSAEPGIGFIALKEGVHPSVAGFYSVRDLSPYDETYPVFPMSELLKPKLRGFAATSKDAIVELAEGWGRILGTQHAKAARTLEEQKAFASVEQRPGFGKEIAKLAKAKRGGFEQLSCDVAVSYAQQVVLDWHSFCNHLLDR